VPKGYQTGEIIVHTGNQQHELPSNADRNGERDARRVEMVVGFVARSGDVVLLGVFEADIAVSCAQHEDMVFLMIAESCKDSELGIIVNLINRLEVLFYQVPGVMDDETNSEYLRRGGQSTRDL
jgi:hypothetical protein